MGEVGGPSSGSIEACSVVNVIMSKGQLIEQTHFLEGVSGPTLTSGYFSRLACAVTLYVMLHMYILAMTAETRYIIMSCTSDMGIDWMVEGVRLCMTNQSSEQQEE